jgi:hypothetical protein
VSVAVKTDEDGSKASFYDTLILPCEALSHSALAASCGLMKEYVTTAQIMTFNKGLEQCSNSL